MLRSTGIACGLVLATGCLVRAQVITETTTTTTSAPAGATELRRVSQILGSSVLLQGTNNFGKVEDIVLGENGSPSYLVVAANGRYVMMPWNAADVNYGRRVVTYDVAPQALQPLYFERNAWPNVANPQYTNQVTRIFPRRGVIRQRNVETVQPGGAVVNETEKVKVRPNGKVIVKERINRP